MVNGASFYRGFRFSSLRLMDIVCSAVNALNIFMRVSVLIPLTVARMSPL